jgi:hypothetical protein
MGFCLINHNKDDKKIMRDSFTFLFVFDKNFLQIGENFIEIIFEIDMCPLKCEKNMFFFFFKRRSTYMLF